MKPTDPTESVNDVLCIRETEKALLVRTKKGKELWLPKSQIHKDSEVQAMDEGGTLIVSKWIYDQKEWDKEEDDDTMDLFQNKREDDDEGEL